MTSPVYTGLAICLPKEIMIWYRITCFEGALGTRTSIAARSLRSFDLPRGLAEPVAQLWNTQVSKTNQASERVSFFMRKLRFRVGRNWGRSKRDAFQTRQAASPYHKNIGPRFLAAFCARAVARGPSAPAGVVVGSPTRRPPLSSEPEAKPQILPSHGRNS
jgi:hypothetical protein